MKKNFFYYLFAVICSVGLFTSCSDDDEDTTWQEIPTITDDNVTLSLNDQTLQNATASLNVTSAETGKLTLKNLIYGYETVDVDVTLQKQNETSYNFHGTADLSAPETKSTSAVVPLKVTVSGTVDTAGKMTVDVTTAGWAVNSGIYANDSLSITMDGNKQSNDSQYAVTLTVSQDGAAANLVFSKIANVALNVEANVTLADGKITGNAEPLLGYNIAITGTVGNGKLALDLVSSGFGTIAKMYSANSDAITFNGALLKTGSVSVKVLSATKAQVTLNNILSGERMATIEDAVITKEEGKEIYKLNGKVENSDYNITFAGTVGEDRKLTATITYEVVGAVVGKWNVQKQTVQGMPMASAIFNFATKAGSVTFPEAILNMIPENMKPMFPATMPDAQLQAAIQGLLGSYAVYLQSIEFTKDGKMVATYIDMPKDVNGDGIINADDGNDMTPHSFDMLKYYTKDNQLYLTVSMEDLMGLLPTDKAARAWEPTNILTEGIPFNYQATGNTLAISLATEVTIGTVTFANSMLPVIGLMMPNLAEQLKPIEDILGSVVNDMLPDVKQLEVGLVFEK